MTKSSFLKQSVVALAGLTAATWLHAQNPTSEGQSPSHQNESPNIGQNQTESKSQELKSDTSSTNEVTKINRCSQLIGMEVKNQQGEKLGKVNDVVIDFSSGRVAYVVLNSSSSPFSSEKLHAVPLRAFQPGADGKSIVLNADKNKLAGAEGFAKDQWPSVSSQSWGAEPFWQQSGTEQQQQQTPQQDQK